MKGIRLGIIAAIAPALLGAPSVFAQEYLYPESSPFEGEPEFIAEYNKLLVEKFSAAFESEVILRAIVLSGSKPFAIAIRRSQTGHSLTRLTAKERLWQGSLKDPNRFNRSVDVESCTSAFPSDKAERLYSVWRMALLQTHYPDHGMSRSFKRDGVIYHFAASKDDRMAGQTHSPDEGTAPYYMTKATWTLSQLCDSSRPELWQELESRITDLENALDTDAMKTRTPDK